MLVLILGIVTPSSARAQQSSLTVTPAILDATLRPGETTTMEVTLFNTTDQPLGVQSILAPFTLNPGEELVISSARYDASGWIQVEPANLIIPIGTTATVTITATTPLNVGPGGHYATIYFEPVVELATEQAMRTSIAARVGVLVLFTVTGDVQKNWKLVDLANNVMAESGDVIVTATITNSGNVHILPDATLQIKPMWGRAETYLTFQPALVLPGTTKTIEAVWSDPPPMGVYQVTAKVMTGDESDLEQSISKQMMIIVHLMPFIIFCIGLTGLVIIVTLIKYIQNTRKK